MLRAAAIVICAGVLAVGCTPTPTPTPTPTGFANEAEAFAAAEATYRAYVDALNQVDLADPTTFEEVYRWTTGDANAGARESFSQMNADGWTVGGRSIVASITPSGSNDSSEQEISALVCLDVSAVTLTDPSGSSVVAEDRRPIQSMAIVVVFAPTTTGGLISSIDGAEVEACE